MKSVILLVASLAMWLGWAVWTEIRVGRLERRPTQLVLPIANSAKPGCKCCGECDCGPGDACKCDDRTRSRCAVNCRCWPKTTAK